MSQYYRYVVTVTDGGKEIRVDARAPDGKSIKEPGGPCKVAEQLEKLRQLAEQIKQPSARPGLFNELGEALFNALFPPDVMGDFRGLLTKVMGEKSTCLRLELDLDEYKLPAIAALPWEFLRAPQTSRQASDNLASHPRVALSRRRPLWDAASPLALTEPLRIQLIVSSPKDEKLGWVAYEEIEIALQELARKHSDQIAPPLETLHAPTIAKIEHALEKHEPHIVHFIGHGRLQQVRGIEVGELALVDAGGWPDWTIDEKFAQIFQVYSPKVVVLQACEGGSLGQAGAFVGVASQIVQRNVPVVVGMQYPISNHAAVTFAEEFYHRLGELKPVDTAVQWGRRLLEQTSSEIRDYAAPVLFMRVEDGRLFVPPKADEADEQTRESPSSRFAFPQSFTTDLPHPLAVTCAAYNEAENEKEQFEALDWLLNNFVKYITAVALSQYWQDHPEKEKLRTWLGALSESRLSNSLAVFDQIHAHYLDADPKPYLFPALFESFTIELDDASPILAVYETIRRLKRGRRLSEAVTIQTFLSRLIAFRESKWERDAGKVEANIRSSLLPDLAAAFAALLSLYQPLFRYPLHYVERIDQDKEDWVYTTIEFPGAAGEPVVSDPLFIERGVKKPGYKDRRLYLCYQEGKPLLNLHPFLIQFLNKLYFLEQADDQTRVFYQHCASSERYEPPKMYSSLFLNATKTETEMEAAEDPVQQLEYATQQLEEDEDKQRLDRMPLPTLIAHLSEEGREALEIGLGEALRLGKFWLGVEFLLMGLSKQRGRPLPILLREMGFHPGDFRGYLRGAIRIVNESWREQDPLSLGQKALPQVQVAAPELLAARRAETGDYPPVITPRLMAILQEAYVRAGKEQIGHRHLLASAMKQYRANAMQMFLGLAYTAEWSPDQVFKRVEELVNAKPEELPSGTDPVKGSPQFPHGRGDKQPLSTPDGSILARIGYNLTQAAAAGKLGAAHGENARRALAEMGRVLLKKEGNNPIILGEAGVGKTAVVEGFAWRLAGQGKGIVPQLEGKQIIQLSPADLTAGTKYRGDLESRLQQLLDEVKQANGQIIIFIDEIHTILSSDSASGMSTIAEKLKPALARGEFPCIGATTVAEYRRYIEKDPALARRFTPVWLEEPTVEDAIQIVTHVARTRLSEHHGGITFTKKGIETAVSLTARYLHDERLPGKAIKVLDEAASSLILGGSLSGDPMDISMIADRQVNSKIVTHIVAAHTNIPAEQLAKSNNQRLRELKARLKARITGQDDAVDRVVRVLKRAGTGFANEKRPLGVFLFTGPTGVGKTELALALAEALFDDEEAILRLDMSEFMEKHQVSRLIGAPPGYVRSDEEGQLTGRLRRRPYSVVLLDEMEKAHEDVQHLFLQLFDNGRLTDNHGNVADGRNAIFIMTTNLGAKEVMGFGQTPTYREKLKTALYDHFSPEFMNRLDRIVYFEPLGEEALLAIFDKEFAPFQERFNKQGVSVEIPEAIKRKIVHEAAKQKMGARPLQRIIEDQIVSPLIDKLLDEEVSEGTIHVGEDIEVRTTSLAPWANSPPLQASPAPPYPKFDLRNLDLGKDKGFSPLPDGEDTADREEEE